MRILIADKLVPEAGAQLRDAGHEVVEEPKLVGDALTARLATLRADALVVRSTKVGREALAASPTLSLVVRAGAGVNTIDLQAAGELGVFVANCPGRNAVAVAELTLGLVVALDRRIPDNVQAAREGRWDKAAFSKADGLQGKRMALLGFGAIGQAVARRARAFGLEVVAWSRSLTPAVAAEHGVEHAATPLEAARGADILSVHLAKCADTLGLVDADVLGVLAEGAYVLNTAREGLVDEDALREALDARGLWAALDVFEGEPAGKTGSLDTALARHPRVYLTHHIGASTAQAQHAVAAEVVRVLSTYDATGRAPNCVNLVRRTRADHLLVVRHRDRVGVLAGVLDALRRARINVQEMENILFDGGGAAVARIQVHGDPAPVAAELEGLDEVLHVAHVPIPKEA